MKKFSILIALMISIPTLASADEYLYVMSAQAKILSSPDFSSQSLGNLSKGEKMVNMDKNNNWFKVRHGKTVGWVSRLSVSPHPPVKRLHRLAKVDDKLQNNSRRRASNVSTTAAVRGLRNMDRNRLNSKDAMDYAALEQMEQLNIAQSDVYAFMDNIGQ